MKKLIVLVACLAFSTSAFAATSITDAQTTSIGGSPFTPSTKVTLSVLASTIAYSVSSCHLSGTREYGTVGGSVDLGEDASTIGYKAIPDQSGNTVCVPTAPTDEAVAPFTYE